MSNTTTSTTNANANANANAKPSAVPTAKVFQSYVDELIKAGAEVEKAAAKIALAATRQAAHRSSLTYLNAACAAFRACHLTCMPQLMRYALGTLGGLASDDNGKTVISRSKAIIRVTDVKERKTNGGDAFAWSIEPKDARAKDTLSRARRILTENEYSSFLTAPTATAQYVREDGQTQSERELLALLRWARRNNKTTTSKRAGERGYPELQNALRAVKALFKEFND